MKPRPVLGVEQVAIAGVEAERYRAAGGTVSVSECSSPLERNSRPSPAASIVPSMKFMVGVPKKPATNCEAGRL